MTTRRLAYAGAQDRTVTIPYRVPINVIVNLGTGTVGKVVVLDELIERDDPLGVRDADWKEIADPDITERALDVAETHGWPAGQFGS